MLRAVADPDSVRAVMEPLVSATDPRSVDIERRRSAVAPAHGSIL